MILQLQLKYFRKLLHVQENGAAEEEGKVGLIWRFNLFVNLVIQDQGLREAREEAEGPEDVRPEQEEGGEQAEGGPHTETDEESVQVSPARLSSELILTPDSCVKVKQE